MISEIQKSAPYFFLSVSCKTDNPATPESKDPTSTAIFEPSIKYRSLKASNVMNIDMVNPMPANIPKAKMFFIFNVCGSKHQPRVSPIQENRKMPSGLPSVNPRITPRLLNEVGSSMKVEGTVMAVFANAKSGRTTHSTRLLS